MADPFLDALASVRQKPNADPFLAALYSVREPAPDPDEGPSLTQTAVRTGARVVPSVLGAIGGGMLGAPAGPAGVLAGGMAGGAAGAGLGELAAEYLESREGPGQVRQGINPTQVGTQTLLGAIPLPGARAGASVLRTLVGQGAKGGVLGGGAHVATSLAEGEAPTVGGVAGAAALGAVLGGGAGVAARRPAAAPTAKPVGFLRAGPGFIADDSGRVATFGETIPMQQASDGSYVRAVPGEFARREVRGLLPPGPDFIADDAGRVATLAQAGAQGDAFTAALQQVRASASSGVRAVPAAIADREFEGAKVTRRIFSSDPTAVDAPKVQLSDAEAHELRRIVAELESMPFTKRSFIEAGARHGGDLEVVGGAAGAPVFQDIIKPLRYQPSRGQVHKSVKKLLAGEHTALGQEALEVARLRLAGDRSVSRPMLPPEAGDVLPVRGDVEGPPTSGKAARLADAEAGSEQLDHLLERLHGPEWERVRLNPAGYGTAADEGFEAFSRAVDELSAGAAADEGVVLSAFGAGQGRQLLELARRHPAFAVRLATSLVGGATGAATPGDGASLEDRLLGAVTGAGLGYAGGRLVTRGTPRALPGGAAMRTLSPASRGPIPPAGQIPATRLHTMPTLTDDVQEAAEAILEQHGGFVRQRRGVQGVARTEGLADQIDVRTDRAVAPGTAANAERLRAYQNATATILKKQQALEARLKAGTATPVEQLELEKVRSEADVLTKSLRGMTAEAGRALHILRYQARILQSGDTEAIREAVQASRRGLSEQAQSIFYSNILSGIATHERNVLGNLSNAVYNLAAHPFAVGADVARSAATKQARQVFLGELPERVAGTVVALPRAFSNALRALRTGIPAADVTTFDRPAIREFRGGGANPFNYPKRLLESVDDFFSTVAAEQTLYGAAFAHAKREGLTGDAFLRRVADLKVNPSDEILREVESNRARLLFREKPGKIADAVLAAKRHLPALTYVLPFVRVPANIIRQGLEASPAGFGMTAAREGGRAGADAMGRAALGTVALAPLAYYAAMGKITGDAPADPAKRAAFFESGRRPNSFQIGGEDGTWYSYQPIQPLNVPLSVIANGFQVWRDAQGDPDVTADQIATRIIGGTASSLLDQSFLSGLSALVDALGDPERYGKRFVQQLATGFVPFSGALRTITQATDPVVRAPQSVAEGVQAIIPGRSQTLDPRLTRFGEPVERVEGALNVFKPSPTVNDPIAAELERLDINLRPARGPKALSVTRGVQVPLSSDLSFQTGQASGRVMRQALEQTMQSPTYERSNDFVRTRMLERAIAEAREAVKQQAVRTALLERMRGAGAR